MKKVSVSGVKEHFFEVRVFNPNSKRYLTQTIKQCYEINKNEEKHYYNERIMEVNQGSFTPLVFKGEWWSQSEKCPATEFFLVHIFLTRTEYGDLWSKSPYASRVRESTDEWVLYFHAVSIAGECKMFYSRLGSLPLIKPAIKNSQITA